MKKKDVITRESSRRSFLKSVGGAAALSTLGIAPTAVHASDLPKLEESDPTAKALNYLHDADAVAEALRAQKDRYCFNCALYAGAETDEWAGCSIFPGKSVAGRGWCSVWAPRQGS